MSDKIKEILKNMPTHKVIKGLPPYEAKQYSKIEFYSQVNDEVNNYKAENSIELTPKNYETQLKKLMKLAKVDPKTKKRRISGDYNFKIYDIENGKKELIYESKAYAGNEKSAFSEENFYYWKSVFQFIIVDDKFEISLITYPQQCPNVVYDAGWIDFECFWDFKRSKELFTKIEEYEIDYNFNRQLTRIANEWAVVAQEEPDRDIADIIEDATFEFIEWIASSDDGMKVMKQKHELAKENEAFDKAQAEKYKHEDEQEDE